ncbi:hypothetical protein [Aquimarina sp. 2201CG5-10]|uniref:hypothetical protein n=1 Tax=Aquimarina callyspongiae TaxID=3098150 RepID=UPI002AB41EF3|nr:hypothetical protein [Aquimarina sp. 2201CG5-10]MDY8138012.1 hypothetical protein [Aquimarina sp. 2201CG5-10]
MKKVLLLITGIVFLVSCKSKTETSESTNEIRLFKGMFSYVAESESVYFTECGQPSTVSMAVLKENDFSSLFDAYKKRQTDNAVDFVYVEFKGFISDKKIISEVDDMGTISVTEFLKMKKRKKCN